MCGVRLPSSLWPERRAQFLEKLNTAENLFCVMVRLLSQLCGGNIAS